MYFQAVCIMALVAMVASRQLQAVTKGALSNADAASILNGLNEFRGKKLAYPAADMKQLAWSEALSAEALTSMNDACAFDPIQYAKVQATFIGYGDSGIGNTIDGPFITNTLATWGDACLTKELKSPNFQVPPMGSPLSIGNQRSCYDYKLVVHSTMTNVGCAYNQCGDNQRVLVCKFDGVQNLDNVYTHGESCSSCPDSCDSSGYFCSTKPTLSTPTIIPAVAPLQYLQ